MTLRISSLIIFALLLHFPLSGKAQFTCSFSGSQNAADCTAMTDDGDAHCVWCSVGGGALGFCVSEVQAEAMEKSIPAVQCDRYSANDDAVTDDDETPQSDDGPVPIDDTVPSDDAPVDTDDTTPTTDDANNDDHSVPDNFWTCLQKKDAASCAAADCTWCDTKGGFGLCMTGPTAESASHSAWFTCRNHTDIAMDDIMTTTTTTATTTISVDACTMHMDTADACRGARSATGAPCAWCTLLDITTICLAPEQVSMGRALGISCNTDPIVVKDDPYDPSCLLAYLQDPSKEGCVAAVDEVNQACVFCSLQGAMDLCLTAEQSSMGEQLGITCDAAGLSLQDDPYDPSCLLAYVLDPSKEGCVAGVDEDNNPCEFCSLQGSMDLCLTSEQASMAEQLGITCEAQQAAALNVQDDPYDPSCLLAYLQDPSKDGCVAAVDEDNQACEFCSLQGAMDLCLTSEQAAMGEQLGITCEAQQAAALNVQDDPYDPSCLLAYLQDPSKDGCVAAVDEDNQACEFCSLQGAMDLCLTSEQAAMGEQLGITCEANNYQLKDPYDPSCMAAYWMDQSEQECIATTDQSGGKCQYCTLPGSFVACLTFDQAQVGKALGMQCNGEENVSRIVTAAAAAEESAPVAFPDDFFTCLQNYEEGDCRAASCTWCDTEVGMGFCLAPAAAESTKQCSFFDCQFDNVAEDVNDIYDPVCLTAGMSADSNDDVATLCDNTNGSDGQPCVWCDAAGVFGLCLSSEQAAAAGNYLQCNTAVMA